MTQADGVLPEAAEIRQVLGRAKIVMTAYEQTLVRAAAGMSRAPRVDQTYELLAQLSEAHAALAENLEAVRTTLGLPYERVIEVQGELIP